MLCAQHFASLASSRCRSLVKASPEADYVGRLRVQVVGQPGPWLSLLPPVVMVISTREEQERLRLVNCVSPLGISVMYEAEQNS